MTVYTGILLEVLAAAIGTTSKQLIAASQKHRKRRLLSASFDGPDHVEQQRRLETRWRCLGRLGVFMNIAVGPLVDAWAYAFAPQVIIAPFACLDIIFNALSAPYTLRWQNERITWKHLLGTLLVSLGASLSAMFGPQSNDQFTVFQLEMYLLRVQSLAYLGAEALCILVLNIGNKLGLLGHQVRGLSFGVVAGVLMGNVFCVKGIFSLARSTIAGEPGSGEAWVRPTPYCLILLAVFGAVYGNTMMRRGLAEYKGVFMVTVFEGAHITAACLSGCIVMSEMQHSGWRQFLLYWFAICLIMSGIYAINLEAGASSINMRSVLEVEEGSFSPSLSQSLAGPYLSERSRSRVRPSVNDCSVSMQPDGFGGVVHEEPLPNGFGVHEEPLPNGFGGAILNEDRFEGANLNEEHLPNPNEPTSSGSPSHNKDTPEEVSFSS